MRRNACPMFATGSSSSSNNPSQQLSYKEILYTLRFAATFMRVRPSCILFLSHSIPPSLRIRLHSLPPTPFRLILKRRIQPPSDLLSLIQLKRLVHARHP